LQTIWDVLRRARLAGYDLRVISPAPGPFHRVARSRRTHQFAQELAEPSASGGKYDRVGGTDSSHASQQCCLLPDQANDDRGTCGTGNRIREEVVNHQQAVWEQIPRVMGDGDPDIVSDHLDRLADRLAPAENNHFELTQTRLLTSVP
jgi:hypothetical protein